MFGPFVVGCRRRATALQAEFPSHVLTNSARLAQSPHVSPRSSFASLDRRLSGLAISDAAEFPVVPPERSLVKATIVWRHSGQV